MQPFEGFNLHVFDIAIFLLIEARAMLDETSLGSIAVDLLDDAEDVQGDVG